MSLVTACSSPAISADVEQQFTGLLSKGLSGVEVHPLVTLTLEEFQFILILNSELKPLRHLACSTGLLSDPAPQASPRALGMVQELGGNVTNWVSSGLGLPLLPCQHSFRGAGSAMPAGSLCHKVLMSLVRRARHTCGLTDLSHIWDHWCSS